LHCDPGWPGSRPKHFARVGDPGAVLEWCKERRPEPALAGGKTSTKNMKAFLRDLSLVKSECRSGNYQGDRAVSLRHACGPSSPAVCMFILWMFTQPRLAQDRRGFLLVPLTPVQPSLVSGQGKRSRRCPRSHTHSQDVPRLLATSLTALIRPNCDGRHCFLPVLPLKR
jgi:hypothetical protein